MYYQPKKNKPPGKNVKLDNCFEKISVLVADLPQNIEISIIEEYQKSILPDENFSVIYKKNISNQKSRGFAFIHFDEIKKAEAFISKDYFYDGKKLDCKILSDNNSYIEENLYQLRNPQKVYAEGIPKKITVGKLKETMSSFGQIGDITPIENKCGNSYDSYITFENSESAKSCVKSNRMVLSCQSEISFCFARPRFSNYMIKKIHPIQGIYIKKIKHSQMSYFPEDFIKVEDSLLEQKEKIIIQEGSFQNDCLNDQLHVFKGLKGSQQLQKRGLMLKKDKKLKAFEQKTKEYNNMNYFENPYRGENIPENNREKNKNNDYEQKGQYQTKKPKQNLSNNTNYRYNNKYHPKPVNGFIDSNLPFQDETTGNIEIQRQPQVSNLNIGSNNFGTNQNFYLQENQFVDPYYKSNCYYDQQGNYGKLNSSEYSDYNADYSDYYNKATTSSKQNFGYDTGYHPDQSYSDKINPNNRNHIDSNTNQYNNDHDFDQSRGGYDKCNQKNYMTYNVENTYLENNHEMYFPDNCTLHSYDYGDQMYQNHGNYPSDQIYYDRHPSTFKLGNESYRDSTTDNTPPYQNHSRHSDENPPININLGYYNQGFTEMNIFPQTHDNKRENAGYQDLSGQVNEESSSLEQKFVYNNDLVNMETPGHLPN